MRGRKWRPRVTEEELREEKKVGGPLVWNVCVRQNGGNGEWGWEYDGIDYRAGKGHKRVEKT